MQLNLMTRYGFNTKDIKTDDDLKKMKHVPRTNFLKWKRVQKYSAPVGAYGDILFGIKNNEDVVVHVIIYIKPFVNNIYAQCELEPGETFYLTHPLVTINYRKNQDVCYVIHGKCNPESSSSSSSTSTASKDEPWIHKLLIKKKEPNVRIDFLYGYIQDIEQRNILEHFDFYFYDECQDKCFFFMRGQICGPPRYYNDFEKYRRANSPYLLWVNWDHNHPHSAFSEHVFYHYFKEYVSPYWMELDVHTYDENCHVLK